MKSGKSALRAGGVFRIIISTDILRRSVFFLYLNSMVILWIKTKNYDSDWNIESFPQT